MNEVLKHLELKNFWFKKFLLSCEQFLDAIQKNSDFPTEALDFFQGNRERLLKIIKRTEEKLQKALLAPELKTYVPNSEQKTKIQYHMREKDSILAQVLKTDQEILTVIELVKSDTVQKMKSLHKGKKAIANYKSSVKYNDSLDKQV